MPGVPSLRTLRAAEAVGPRGPRGRREPGGVKLLDSARGALSNVDGQRAPPIKVIPGGRIALHGSFLPLPADGPLPVLVGAEPARVALSSARELHLIIPSGATAGRQPIRIEGRPGDIGTVEVGRELTTGVHQVDSPCFDREGRLYVTQSGARDTKVPVPLYRVARDGVREPLAVEIPNPTSVALGPDDRIYVSSRFDGQVFRLSGGDRAEVYASELGVATGLAFEPDGTLFVGDRSGSIMRVTPDKRVETYASIPASVAAFHLALGPDGTLYVTAPTLSTHDAVYRISPDRLVDVVCHSFGRPQGIAFGPDQALYVVEALAGSAGLYRLDVSQPNPVPEQVLSAPALIGVAFGPEGEMVVASSDTVWRF